MRDKGAKVFRGNRGNRKTEAGKGNRGLTREARMVGWQENSRLFHEKAKSKGKQLACANGLM